MHCGNKLLFYWQFDRPLFFSLLWRVPDCPRYANCNLCLNLLTLGIQNFKEALLWAKASRKHTRPRKTILTAVRRQRQFPTRIAPHRLSGTQEDPVATEAKRANCFPFSDERASTGYSSESAPLLLLHCIYSSSANDAKRYSLSVSFYFSRVGRFVTIPFALTSCSGESSLSNQKRESQTSGRLASGTSS